MFVVDFIVYRDVNDKSDSATLQKDPQVLKHGSQPGLWNFIESSVA